MPREGHFKALDSILNPGAQGKSERDQAVLSGANAPQI
jgi:hypothetical protein